VRGPVERAEKRTGRDGRVGRAQRAAPNAAGDERAHAALVPIPLGDDAGTKTRGEGVDLEVRGGAFDLVDQAEDVGDRHVVQTIRQRPAIFARGGQRVEEAIDGAILTEEEELVLAAEVVIQVARRQVGGDGDVAHAGGAEAASARHATMAPTVAAAATNFSHRTG